MQERIQKESSIYEKGYCQMNNEKKSEIEAYIKAGDVEHETFEPLCTWRNFIKEPENG